MLIFRKTKLANYLQLPKRYKKKVTNFQQTVTGYGTKENLGYWRR